MFGRSTRSAPGPDDGAGGSDRLQQALARLPMPDSPASQPWEFSGAALLRPVLPGPFTHATTLLNRLGAVRLGPAGIGIDHHGTVAWSDVVEVRTCSLFDVVSDGFVEDLQRRSRELVPRLPGTGRVIRWAADQVAELVLSLVLLAIPDAPGRGVPDVPAEIAYRDRRGRPQEMTPGLVASAVLAPARGAESVLATARAHGVAVVARGASAVVTGAGERSAALQRRRAQLAAQLERLRGRDGAVDPDVTEQDEDVPVPLSARDEPVSPPLK